LLLVIAFSSIFPSLAAVGEEVNFGGFSLHGQIVRKFALERLRALPVPEKLANDGFGVDSWRNFRLLDAHSEKLGHLLFGLFFGEFFRFFRLGRLLLQAFLFRRLAGACLDVLDVLGDLGRLVLVLQAEGLVLGGLSLLVLFGGWSVEGRGRGGVSAGPAAAAR
jgi:hypothetical protein